MDNAKFKQHISSDHTIRRSSYVKHGPYITSIASDSCNVQVTEPAVVQLQCTLTSCQLETVHTADCH